MQSIMGGQRTSFLSRISYTAGIFRAYLKGSYGNPHAALKVHDELIGVYKLFCKKPLEQAKILDLGCGQTAIQTALFQIDGASCIGVDAEIPTFGMTIKTFIKTAKLNGIERAVKSAMRHILFDRRFFRNVWKIYGKKSDLSSLDIRIGDAENLEFKDNSFDFVFSSWVFEHIRNVEKALGEVNRILKPDGISYTALHLFPSISGGHNPEWLHPEKSPSKKVPPWDHLRENKYPANAYLNRKKLDDFRVHFNNVMDLVEENTTKEGENLLSNDILHELTIKGYTKEDLTTRTVTFIARKKA